MARSKEEIKFFLETLKAACKKELGKDFLPSLIMYELAEMRSKRISSFLYRYAGHLPDADFLLLNDVVIEELTGPPPKELPPPPAPEPKPAASVTFLDPTKKKRGRPAKTEGN